MIRYYCKDIESYSTCVYIGMCSVNTLDIDNFRIQIAYTIIFLYFQLKAGLILNVVGVIIVLLSTMTIGSAIFDLDTIPWANDTIDAMLNDF